LFVIYQTTEIFLVMELMPLGNLHHFLLQNRLELSFGDLLGIAKDSASGLNYLHKKAIIHGDLAARNLLVKRGDKTKYSIKIADFGLSQRIHDSYILSSSTSLPIKWSAPEVLMYRKFTTKSDIYSFGVVVYELTTYGELPWSNLSNKDALNMIVNGKVLDRPENCPSFLYDLMLQCWRAEFSDRPSASELLTALANMEQDNSQGVQFEQESQLDSDAIPSQFMDPSYEEKLDYWRYEDSDI